MLAESVAGTGAAATAATSSAAAGSRIFIMAGRSLLVGVRASTLSCGRGVRPALRLPAGHAAARPRPDPVGARPGRDHARRGPGGDDRRRGAAGDARDAAASVGG